MTNLLGADGRPWSIGHAALATEIKLVGQTLIIAVRCRFGSLNVEDFALLDTGAEWSVIDSETADALEGEIDDTKESIMMSTRLGRLAGTIHRFEISLLADPDCGNDVRIHGAAVVLEGWTGPSVLGFHGCLERVRVAIDPGLFGSGTLYFGLPQ